MTIIEKILLELCAKDIVEDGIPDFTNEKHLLALNEILVELNWPMEARGELLYTLMEADKTSFVGITKDKKRRYFKDKETLDKAVDADIINKSGSWFSYGDTKIGQGRDAVKSLLQDNPDLMEELELKNKIHLQFYQMVTLVLMIHLPVLI